MRRIIESIQIFIYKLRDLHDHYVRKWETTVLSWHLPAPVGILIILLGLVLVLGGAAMLVLPGQGILTIALGIAAIRIGTRVLKAERNAELPDELSQNTDVPEPAEENRLAQAHSVK
jgi:hypothetical protein